MAELAPSRRNLQKYRNPLWINRFLIQRFYDRVGSFLAGRSYGRVLDAGCGEGMGLERMRPYLGSAALYGVDIHTQAITLASESSEFQSSFCAGSLFQLPLSADSFDLVTCLETLEHLDDPPAALAEIHRVTRQWCLLSVPWEPCFRSCGGGTSVA